MKVDDIIRETVEKMVAEKLANMQPVQFVDSTTMVCKIRSLEQDLKFHHQRLNVQDNILAKHDLMIRTDAEKSMKDIDALDKRISNKANTQTARIELLNARVNTLASKFDPFKTIGCWDVAYPGSTAKTAGITTNAVPEEAQADACKDATETNKDAANTVHYKRISREQFNAIADLASRLERLVHQVRHML